ncbi:DUF4956 domain-containing protein [Catenuloplanes indicus]|uniref:DUF4956 domain-containing protein n=1 Tax=Catenuloplanes indicus TaxID=137267 RepID=A0AAE3WA28_9ACTN|nr:DUF4956 domain-containing protein [Catenuloplanes indicus]MDQ0371230.1 hypothetical protein [Catenuloplanes indicus]
MQQLLVIAVDLVAIGVLVFAVYFPRHHRRDLVAAFLGVNIGVLAVSLVLASSTVGVGLGLGLFGVLSIIRLRSDEIAQHEVAYYFAALALGLLAGLSGTVTPLTAGLMALVVAALVAGDHPALFRRHRAQTLRLDSAHTDEAALTAHLEILLGARVLNVSIKNVDLVNDTTLAEVRYLVSPRRARVADRGPALERIEAGR